MVDAHAMRPGDIVLVAARVVEIMPGESRVQFEGIGGSHSLVLAHKSFVSHELRNDAVIVEVRGAGDRVRKLVKAA